MVGFVLGPLRRPIIPIRDGGPRIVLWLRGIMRTYTSYDFEVVALLE